MENYYLNDSHLGRKQAVILGVRVDSTSKEELLRKIGQKLRLASKFYIVTPNPEIILQAQTDPRLASILNKADFSLPDGVGLIWAERRLGQISLNLLPGRKIMLELFRLADKEKRKIFLFGSTEAVIEASLAKLARQFPNLQAKGAAGPIFDKNAEPQSERDRMVLKNTLDRINKFSPDFLFVALGAPKQEKWIAKNFDKVDAKCFMAVGGALDYYSGKTKLPPEWMEKAGLEWFWRLVNEPTRIGRIFRATIIFPLKVFLTKLPFR